MQNWFERYTCTEFWCFVYMPLYSDFGLKFKSPKLSIGNVAQTAVIFSTDANIVKVIVCARACCSDRRERGSKSPEIVCGSESFKMSTFEHSFHRELDIEFVSRRLLLRPHGERNRCQEPCKQGGACGTSGCSSRGWWPGCCGLHVPGSLSPLGTASCLGSLLIVLFASPLAPCPGWSPQAAGALSD